MLDISVLREKISKSGLIKEIIEELELPYTSDKFISSATDNEILSAFSTASFSSNRIAKALHKYPLPEDLSVLGKYTGDNVQYHIHGGFFGARLIDQRTRVHGLEIRNAANILDFGCGTSRILRFLAEYCPGPQYFGSDVYNGVIEWGTNAFPDISYILHGNEPPIEKESNFFDAIYAWSIFSHYNESLHKLWLDELTRTLKPSGLLILTIHGKTILDRIMTEKELRNHSALPDDEAKILTQDFLEKGFSFRKRYNVVELASGGLDANSFGLAYISPDYINLNWTKHLELLSVEEGLIGNYQDLVVLRKKNI